MSIELLTGDCVEQLEAMPDDSVDLILTDPPYNLGTFMTGRQAGIHRMRDNFFVSAGWDNFAPSDWEESMDDFFRQAARVARKGASLVCFMAVIKVETLVELAQKHGFYYKTTGVWHKTNPMPRNMNLQFINSTESWVYFVHGSRTGTFNNEGLAVHDFVESGVAPTSERKHGKHPTQKPVKLMEHFVTLLSNPGDTVLDPFMGSGSTGVACKKLGRSFVGIDLNHAYVAMAAARMEETEEWLIK